MSSLCVVEDHNSVRLIRLNRPEKKNALTLGMYEMLAHALRSANSDPVRSVLITGGTGAFCAGNDMADFVAAREAGALGRPVLDFLSALVSCEKPLVAAVADLAIGVGATMLFHFDYVVADKSARFEAPFIKLGLAPEAASGLIAPNVMGHRHAFAMLILGHPLTADEARQAGLVNRVVKSSELELAATTVALEIAALPPGAVAAGRRLLKGDKDKLLARLVLEDEVQKERLKSPETNAAFDRFLSRKR